MSLASCLRKFGRSFDAGDAQRLQELVDGGMDEMRAIDEVMATASDALSELVGRIEAAGGKARYVSAPLMQRAFHGSPHTFDRFNLEKINTGEGAQAFGWGLYFTSKKEIAEWYRNKLSPDSYISPTGTRVGELNASEAIASEVMQRYGVAGDRANLLTLSSLDAIDIGHEALRRLQRGTLDKFGKGEPLDPSMPADESERGKLLRNARRVAAEYTKKWKYSPLGKLYEVDIPENDELLDWGATTLEQPEGVWRTFEGQGLVDRGAFAQAAEAEQELDEIASRPAQWHKEHPEATAQHDAARERFTEASQKIAAFLGPAWRHMTGRRLYVKLSEYLFGDRRASMTLRAAGIKGHKYLGDTSGVTNYVIYDDAAIETKAMYSRPGLELTAPGTTIKTFHGTLDSFRDYEMPDNDIGIHVGDTPEQANDRLFAKAHARFGGPDTSFFMHALETQPLEVMSGANVRRQDIVVRNPLRVNDEGWGDPIEVAGNIAESLPESERQAFLEFSVKEIGFASKAAPKTKYARIRRYLQGLGYDSLSYLNEVEGVRKGEKRGNAYVLFTPQQVTRYYSRAGAIPTGTPDDVQEMLERLMAPAPESTSIKDRARETVRGLINIDYDRIKQGLIDSANSIKLIEEGQFGAVLDAAESPYKATLATKNLPSVMTAVMMRGVPIYKEGVFQVSKGRKGIVEIFRPLTEHKDGNLLPLWELYAAAKRAKVLRKQGREKLFSDADIQKAERLGQEYPLLETVAKDWEQFNNELLDLAVDRGVLDKGMVAKWRDNFYVPFYRAMETAAGVEGPGTKGGLGAHGGQRAKKRLKGSEKPLGHVFENMLMNTAYLIDEAFKNTAMQKIAAMAEGVAMERVPLKWDAVRLPAAALESALNELGATVMSQRKIRPGEETQVPDALVEGQRAPNWQYGLSAEEREEWLKLFRRVAPIGKDIVSVFENGKPVYYRVTDDLLLRSVQNMGFDSFSDVFGLFRGSKRLLTGAVTLDPAFMMANWVRDTLSTWVVSGAPGMKPVIDSIRGAKAAFLQDEDSLAIMMGGGGGSGVYDMQPAEIRKFLVDKLGSESAATRFQNSVLTPKGLLRFWRRLGNAAENANRVATYRAVRAAGGSVAEAVYQARDVLNFTMSGDFAAMRWLTATVPFMNARVQGLYRLWRGAQDNPVSFALKGSMIMAATLALLLRNNDNEEYEQLPEWDKDTYWHFFVDGEHFRLPKPFEVGAIFGTIPERVFRLGTGRDSASLAKERAMAMLGETFAFNPVPQLIKPVIEQYANRSFFTGSPIVGLGELNLQPEAQYTPWTSEAMRAMAEALPDWAPAWLRSPRRLEHFVRGYLGAMGTYAMGAGDVMARNALGHPEAPARRIYDMPVVRRFLQDPNPRVTKYADQLYEMLDEANAVFSTINRYKQQGRLAEAQELLQENRGKLAARARLNQIATQVRNLNNRVRLVMFNQTMTAEEKREQIDALNARKNELTARVAPYADLF